MDKMKAANGLNFGDVNSPDFPNGTLIMKDGKLCVIPKALNQKWPDYYIEQSNVQYFKLIGCGGSWAKYYLKFKDGKRAVITQQVLTLKEQQAQGISMVSLETYLYLDEPTSFNETVVVQPQIQPTIMNEERSDNNPVIESNDEKPEPKVVEEKPLVCPKCGSPIEDDMMFCGECGAKLK